MKIIINTSPKTQKKKYKNAEEQEEAHLKHTINGFIFGNLPGLVMKKGERIRWHIIGMGNEVDLHSAQLCMDKLSVGHQRCTDVVEGILGSRRSVDMVH